MVSDDPKDPFSAKLRRIVIKSIELAAWLVFWFGVLRFLYLNS